MPPHGEALSLRDGPNAPASLTIGADLPCNGIPKIKAALNSDIKHDKTHTWAPSYQTI